MITFLPTYEQTIEAAKKAEQENENCYTKKGQYNCDCGESFAVHLISHENMEILETFCECEACNRQYEVYPFRSNSYPDLPF